MKKLIIIISLFVGALSYGQGGSLIDALKFRGEVTTAIRDTFDVPVGQNWIIYNVTTSQYETSGSDDVWTAFGGSTPTLSEVLTSGSDAGNQSITNVDSFSANNEISAWNIQLQRPDATPGDAFIEFNDNNGNANTLFNDQSDGNKLKYINAQSGLTFDLQDIGTDDQTAAEVPFTPNGDIAAITTQLAIQEVRDEAVVGTGEITTTQILNGTVDELDLDVSVNASLDLADTALQSFIEVDGSVTNEIQTATEVTITDAGGNYTATDVEGALAENLSLEKANQAIPSSTTRTISSGASGSIEVQDSSGRTWFETLSNVVGAAEGNGYIGENVTFREHNGTDDNIINLNFDFATGTDKSIVATPTTLTYGGVDMLGSGGGVDSDITGLTGAGAITNIVTGTTANIEGWAADAGRLAIPTDAKDYKYIQVALSDLSTTLTTGTKNGMWIAPADGTIESPANDGIAIVLDVSGTATGINIDINKNGADIATTNVTTDATEPSSDTATTDFVLSSYTFVRGDKFLFDIDAVPTSATGAQLILKVYYD